LFKLLKYKQNKMESIYLKIDTRTKQAKYLLDYLKSLKFVEVVDDVEEELSLMEQIEVGLREVNMMQKGILKEKTLDEFIEELKNE